MKLSSVFWVVLVSAQGPSELEEAVSQYWSLLAEGNKVDALEFVEEESRNAFIRRPELSIRSWGLEEFVALDAHSFKVTVRVKQFGPGGFQDRMVIESWMFSGSRWKVSLPDGPEERRLVWQGAPLTVTPGVIKVLPKNLRIHYISPTQIGTIVIANGLDKEVRLPRLKYNGDLFEILQSVQVVASGETGELRLRYRGKETKKNLEDKIELVLQYGTKEEVLEIPISYNVVSEGTRSLLGLSPEKAETLKRADPMVPKIKPPK